MNRHAHPEPARRSPLAATARRLAGRSLEAVRASVELPEHNVAVWDGWRGLAIAAVMIGHFMNTTFIKDDRFGVDLFFVLSGMLMARLLFEKRVPLQTFYLRRFSRIFPALLVFVLLVFGASALVGFSFTWLEVVANLTFLRTYVPADPHIWSGPVPVKNLWSLNVEEHAYVLMSLVTLSAIAVRRAGHLMLALGCASILVSLYYLATQDYEETFFLLRTECAISFIAFSAAYHQSGRARTHRTNGWAPPAALLLAALCYLDALPLWVSVVFPPLLLAFAVNHALDCAEPVRRALAARPLRLLGVWSYSIYLWQQPVYEYKWAVPGPSFALPLMAALVLGYLSYTFIEKPTRSAINRWWASRAAAKGYDPGPDGRHVR